MKSDGLRFWSTLYRRDGVFVVCGGSQCPASSSLLASPNFSNNTVYNGTSYQCIWVFNCHGPPSSSTILEFLAFNLDDVPTDCDSNFVEIREGLVWPPVRER